MELSIKTQIRTRLSSYCKEKGSHKKAADFLKGVSTTTISKIIGNEWADIDDDMWRNIENQIVYKRVEWRHVETKAYKLITKVLKESQEESSVCAIVGCAGSGKSLAIKNYAQSNKEVSVLSCGEYWNRKIFLQELSSTLGTDVSGFTVSEMMQFVLQTLKSKDYPLVIFDEADKLSDQVLHFFITMYNHLEDSCGIVLVATDYLSKKIIRGVRNNRRGYAEIYSRVGKRFIEVPTPSDNDVKEVLFANGLSDLTARKYILSQYNNDLRRVKRLCVKATKIQEKPNAHIRDK